MTDAPPTPRDEADVQMVTALLGRKPMGQFAVSVRRHDRSPVVLSNAPLFHGGRPMPTRFWLCDPFLVHAISQLESEGGVRTSESEIEAAAIQRTHALASAERDAHIPAGHEGPRPFGGVGGTRQGVKCLHTHFGNFLAGAPDAIGTWVRDALAVRQKSYDPAKSGVGSR